jgi:arabinofuranan 3-O-arabinosyltransferase
MAIVELARPLRALNPTKPLDASSVAVEEEATHASRWWLIGAFAISLAAVLPEAFGRQFVDTKLDLTTSPTTMLAHMLNLWDPNGWFGYLQDQYQGYLFPVAPLFALGHVLAVPSWITERLWMALLITTAFWGVVRLAEALRIGTLPTRIAGAAVYALWPVFTILIGINSSAIAPGVLLPWVLLPLVKGSRSGSTLRAAALSGLAVLFIGGVNAADTLDVLIVPALFLLTRQPSPRRRSLMGWWVACTALATLWWLIPLLFLGKYGFNFLPYTEQAVTTTGTMSAPASLLGIGDWVAYLNFGGQLWDPGGSILVTYPAVLIGLGLTAGVGLFGLARRELSEGRFLRIVFAVGAVCAMAAYWGSFGGPLGSLLRPVLNSGLAPFRNVFKFEPLLALPMALGVVQTLKVLRPHLRRTVPIAAVSVLALACVTSLAWPYVRGSVSTPQSFTSIPGYWNQTADYLAKHAPHTDALVLPASAHGLYAWGWTIDEPLEALAKSPWVDREVAPYSGAGSTRVIDAID